MAILRKSYKFNWAFLMQQKSQNTWLVLAGTGAFFGGLLHIVALIGGPEWIAFFGAPASVVESARQGTWLAPAGSLVITALMWLCSVYAFSGAGWIARLPLLRTGLFAIALVCIARGVVLVPLVLMRPKLLAHIGTFEIVAALIWLAIGIAYAMGLRGMRARPLAQAARIPSRVINRYLLCAGVALVLGALLHIAAIFGGPAWYAAIGAPDQLVQMVREGRSYPIKICLLIASFLLVCAGYAFSGAGLILRLPLLRTALCLISAGLLLRALGLVPLMILYPQALAGICNCKGVDFFLLLTSAICLAIGAAYALGTRQAWQGLSRF